MMNFIWAMEHWSACKPFIIRFYIKFKNLSRNFWLFQNFVVPLHRFSDRLD